MSIIEKVEIPKTDEYFKRIVSNISFTGRRMDKFEGTVVIGSMRRQVQNIAPEYPAVLDGNGEEIYKGDDPIKCDLSEELQENITIDGITTQQVFAWLSKWTDYKKGEEVEGLAK